MTFNHALTYAEFLCKLCFKCHMYLQYILDSVSEFNAHYEGDPRSNANTSVISSTFGISKKGLHVYYDILSIL